mgnify:CR=1 FL=1
MNILVTGGAGYIGSVTAEALIQAGHSVTVYDSLVTGHRAAAPDGVNFVEADLADSHTLVETFIKNKFDAVMHFAAFIEAGESMKDPGRFYQNNFTNAITLAETAVRAGVKRFVLSSTAAVFQSSEEPLNEESPLGPTNVYGHTKLMVEQALEVGEVIGKPVRRVQPLRLAEAAPVWCDDAPVAREGIDEELERGRAIHPAVQQEQLRRVRRPPQAHVGFQAADRQEFGSA